MSLDRTIKNPLEHPDTCPVWDDMTERVEKMVALQVRLKEMAEDFAVSHLDDSYADHVESLVLSHAEDLQEPFRADDWKDQSSIVNELHAEYLNNRN